MERAKRKRYFEQELFENLVTFGCNPQWHELMETCQKIGSANDASNLTRAVEMFLASEKTNPSEYPVDYICKHGDLEMFKTFIKLAKFDLDENQPILKNKLTPYAADHDNLPIAIYLITKMDMEFRISLFENCMAQRDQKLSRILQPFLPPEYSISDVNEINFFLKATNRFMQEIFSPDQNYVVIATKIIGYLDLSSLFTCRSVSKSFKFAIDRETQLWTGIYNKQKDALLEKLNKIDENAAKIKTRWPNPLGIILASSNAILFFTTQWKEIVDKLEDINNLEHCRLLIKKYHQLKNSVKVSHMPELDIMTSRKWIQDQRNDLVTPVSYCINKGDIELFKMILPHINIAVTEVTEEVPIIQKAVYSGNLELVKMVAPYIKLDAPLYHGQNALHIAAHKGYIDIFKFLLEKAESANPRDNTNQTPYDVGTDEIKKYLASEYKSRKIGWYK